MRRMKAGRHEIEFLESLRSVSVLEMLYGIHRDTHERVIEDIQRDQRALLLGQQQIQQNLASMPEMVALIQGLKQQSELIWRQMLRQWNYEMKQAEIACPDIFFLSLAASGTRGRLLPKNWVSQKYRLHIICQYPPRPHAVRGDGYSLREAKEWWLAINPWLNRLVTMLKLLSVGKAPGDLYDTTGVGQIQKQVALMEEVSSHIPQIGKFSTLSEAVPDPHMPHDQQATGEALRTLHQFLIHVDPSRSWGGPSSVVTQDGSILWLCKEHRQEFEAHPLDQRYAQ